MKRFSPDAVENRLKQRLMVHEEWNQVIAQGTVGTLIKAIAESEAEIARYLEYLYLEKKWKTARNASSLMHQAALIGKERTMPRSAIGWILVSHTDEEGKDRLGGYGGIYFDIDTESDYDNATGTPAPNSTSIEKSALVPWLCPEPYAIPLHTVFRAANGIQYVSTRHVESRTLTTPYGLIKSSRGSLNTALWDDFVKSGGWNGIKYLKVPVIQGERVHIVLGFAKGNRFEAFKIDNPNIEAADNSISRNFFKVWVDGVQWSRVANIRLASPIDRVFEMKYISSQNCVMIRFGDDVTGRRLPVRAKIEVDYLESKGAGGNLDNKFQIVSMNPPEGSRIADPRTGDYNEFLSATNIIPIRGGKDIETEDDIRLTAPSTYQKSYTICSLDNYYEKIKRYVPISYSHIKLFAEEELEKVPYTPMAESNSVERIVQLLHRVIKVSALQLSGEEFVDGQVEVVEPIVRSLETMKSPTDSFVFVNPDVTLLKPQLQIKLVPGRTTTNVVEDNSRRAILNEYNIFNSTFGKEFHKSKVNDWVMNADIEWMNVQVDAFAKVEQPVFTMMSGTNLQLVEQGTNLLKFDFKFNTLFARDIYAAGFKNFRLGKNYVIRANIIHKTNPLLSKTLLLLDFRRDLVDDVTLDEAQDIKIKEEENLPSKDADGYYIETDESFANRMSRTAQFDLTNSIISNRRLASLLQFGSKPCEIRPLVVDDFGRNLVFLNADIPDTEQGLKVSLDLRQFGISVTDEYCYKTDVRYMPKAFLRFSECYDEPGSINYATGSIFVPWESLVPRTSTLRARLFADYFSGNVRDIKYDFLHQSLLDYEFEVVAEPISDAIIPDSELDIIYIKEKDIVVEFE